MASGKLWGARLLTVQTTRPLESDGALVPDTYEVLSQADVLTNIGGIHALTAWRRYNAGAVVEQRIEELAQRARHPSMLHPDARGRYGYAILSNPRLSRSDRL